ncbi:HAEPLYID family protein [Flammeovirgaceae bacterium SG7u.111]|nr:HAEPLYID family protein [Flammeovirgaceae bacterium SG7u.132]WPO37641.1 HAEPLYID family protein [Flammeovirgaceae bacterium SG7u.111]
MDHFTKPFLFICCFFLAYKALAQERSENSHKDSLYIIEVEDPDPPKILHAEPLYIDLIRDLGARKGEREWNIGLGLTDNFDFDSYEALVEYEFAPINRLGFEIEVPLLFYSAQQGVAKDSIPPDKIQSLKLATQWSFFVSEKINTSMALGYIHEFELSPFNTWGNPLVKGHVFNPFYIAAKRWGQHFHTLIYTGPIIEKDLQTSGFQMVYEINTNVHYMIPGTRNFMGIEFNKSFDDHDFDMTIRPQMRLEITDQTMIGIVTGIPASRENERFSMFLRLIWEPQTH